MTNGRIRSAKKILKGGMLPRENVRDRSMTSLKDMNPTYQQLLRKLVLSGTLSVLERKSLGRLNKLPVPKSDVAEVIQEILEEHGIFPTTATGERPDGTIYEGFFIEIIAQNRISLRWQRHSVSNPAEMAEEKDWEFHEMKAAMQKFIEWEWPHGIDGIALG